MGGQGFGGGVQSHDRGIPHQGKPCSVVLFRRFFLDFKAFKINNLNFKGLSVETSVNIFCTSIFRLLNFYCLQLARQGMKLLLISRSQDKLDAVASEIGKLGSENS